MDVGFPRAIESDFPGIGKEVDAAVYDSGKGDAAKRFWVRFPMSRNPNPTCSMISCIQIKKLVYSEETSIL